MLFARTLVVVGALVLAGCSSIPTGPSLIASSSESAAVVAESPAEPLVEEPKAAGPVADDVAPEASPEPSAPASEPEPEPAPPIVADPPTPNPLPCQNAGCEDGMPKPEAPIVPNVPNPGPPCQIVNGLCAGERR